MENKKRLIDANELLAIGREKKLIEVFPEWKELPLSAQKAVCKYGGFLKKMIQHLPTVDAVEVVQCKDCKKYRTDSCAMSYTDRNEDMPHYWAKTTDFCSYGERDSNV